MSTIQQTPPATGTPAPAPDPSADPQTPYGTAVDLNGLLADMFARQKQDDLDVRASFKANQARLAGLFDQKNGQQDLPPQVQGELIPLLRSCPQIVPHVTMFTKYLIQRMAQAAADQLTKSMQAINGQGSTTQTAQPAQPATPAPTA